MSKNIIDAKKLSIEAARIGLERNCRDIKILDLKGKSPATDYFVIMTGASDRQMRTVADEISEMAKENKYIRFGMAGYENGVWILLDYVDVMVHIMSEKARDYYNLEMLWGDAKEVKV